MKALSTPTFKKFSLVLSIIVVGSQAPSTAFAIDEASFSTNDIFFYSTLSSLECSAGTVSADLSKNIPSDWGAIFSSAAEKFSVNPNFLAALFLTENGNSWKDINTSWPTSPAGASGPMQFMPGTWSGHKQDGNNDGTMDVNNVYDAIYGAAHLVQSMGTSAGTPLGNINQPWKPNTLLYASAAYNWGGGNLKSNTTENGPLSQAPTETENYLNNVYSLFESDFTKSGHPNYKDPAPDGSVSETVTGAAGTCAADGAVAGNIIETAKNLAWDDPSKDSPAKDSYLEARRKYNAEAGSDMTDCGKFVATVMRASGADTEYPSAGTGIQYAYVKGSSKYKIITSPTMNDLQPGDILIYDGSGSYGHTLIYAGDLGNGLVGVAASLGDHVPHYVSSGSVQYQLERPGNIAARLIGEQST